MHMRYGFASVFLADSPILETKSTWVRAIVKSGFNPIVPQNIVSILPYIVAEQFSHNYPIGMICGLEAYDGSRWRDVRDVFDMCESGLGKCDQESKIF
jgi:hypothetical protein